MNRTTIKKALQRAADGAQFVTQGDIRRCIGCGSDRAAKIVDGLGYIKFNRTKQYDVEEVADRIYQYTES